MQDDASQANRFRIARRLAPCLALMLVSACAANGPRQVALRPTAPVAAPAQNAKIGTIAAVREVDVGPGDGSRDGVNAVLAALGQPTAPGKIALQEVVIEQPGGNPVSLGGAFPDVASGNRVTVLEAQSTSLTRRN